MPTFSVVSKNNGKEVSRYSSMQLNYSEYSSELYDHIEIPEINPSIPTVRIITKNSFWNRFPKNKEIALRAIMKGNYSEMLSGALLRLNSRVDSAPYVDLNYQDTIDGVNALANEDIPEFVTLDAMQVPLRLTLAEADFILNSEILEKEIWDGT
jgi:hypothetical protein